MTRFLIFAMLLGSVSLALADNFTPTSHYQVCFTPGEDCTGEILTVLNHAQKSIRVQAFSFTSKPIAKALVRALQRGVDVKVILDKNTSNQDLYSHHIRDYLLQAGIPIWLDATVTIAHNKVMVVDDSTVITGSFNFTRAAQMSNAENLLIIEDTVLAQKYAENWQQRLVKSESFH
jgi:phosphatidylserine/phosphatidylglycerophosphate/cardiolipin synthase-like enzyme